MCKRFHVCKTKREMREMVTFFEERRIEGKRDVEVSFVEKARKVILTSKSLVTIYKAAKEYGFTPQNFMREWVV